MSRFNEQVAGMTAVSSKFALFADGVQSRFMAGDKVIRFRILPAYNYDDVDSAGNINPAGWVPCRLPDGSLTDWGALIRLVRFVGHGMGKAGNRMDFVSPKSIDENNWCACTHLHSVAAQFAEWRYLIEDIKGADGKRLEGAPLPRVSEFLIANVVEYGGMDTGVILGVFNKSSSDGLLNEKRGGLVHTRAIVSPEQAKADYLSQWAVRDITDPVNGCVLYVTKDEKMQRYLVGLAQDRYRQLLQMSVDAFTLEQRYDLRDPGRLLNVKSDEQQVADLVSVFNARSDSGYHEYALLKIAFSDKFKIPDPPSAASASRTVQSGFAGPQGFAPPAGQQFAPPAVADPLPPDNLVYGPADAPAPVVAPQAPRNGFGPRAAAPRAAAPAPSAAPGFGPVRAAAAAAAPAASHGPVVPGDPVVPANRDEILARLRQSAAVGQPVNG